MAGNVRVVLKSVFDDKGIKEAQKGLGDFGKGLDRAFAVASTAVVGASLAVASFAKSAIEAGSAFEAEFEGVNQVFGESAKQVQNFARNAAQSAGISETAALQAAKGFGVFASTAGLASGEAADFSTKLVQAAGDLASFNDVPVEEALAAIKSGLQGSGEPLTRFGILMNDATLRNEALRQGIISSTKEALTPQQKVLAANALILANLGVAQGDFVKYQDTFGNVIKTVTAEFDNMRAQIGTALLPVVAELVRSIANQLLPKMKEFGDWLKSPAGTKAISDLGLAVTKTFDAFFKFLSFVIDNWKGLTQFATAALSVYAAVKLVTTAMALATTAQLIFNTAVKANPYVLAVTALLALVSAATVFAATSDKAKFSAQAQADQVAILESELEALHRSYNSGAMDMTEYERQVQFLTEKLNTAKISVEGTAGEMRRLNDLRLDAATESMNRFKLATSLAERQAQSFRDSYSYLESIGAVTPKVKPTTVTPTLTGGGGGGPSRAEQIKDVLKESQAAIKSATKSYRTAVKSARADYVASVNRANEAYSEAVKQAEKIRASALAQAASENAQAITRINNDTAKKLADIVAQSINRLRDAFRSAVQTNVADMFATDEVGKSVDNLVASLRDRLQASQRLIQNSAALSAAGFSQTFIEQVVSAGLTAGNELAESVLNATPETQEELRSLFGALETTSETGMDTLAQSIYDGTGLATTGLKQLYADTLSEQTTALAEQAANYTAQQVAIMAAFDQAMQDAATTRDTALADAMKAYQDALKKAMDDFLLELDEVEKKFKEKLLALKAQKADIDKLQAQIDAAKNVVPVPEKITKVINDKNKNNNNTVINVNVKTDSTKSDSQVGKNIATVINKYTNQGGALLIGQARV